MRQISQVLLGIFKVARNFTMMVLRYNKSINSIKNGGLPLESASSSFISILRFPGSHGIKDRIVLLHGLTKIINKIHYIILLNTRE